MKAPSKEQMALNFRGDDILLFQRLRAAAKINRRTLTDEILYRLDRSFNRTKAQEV
jgi:hypothetical protein